MTCNVATAMQLALLRQKLASEQQRAHAAEASLAGQQQLQELLQAAVQAVLQARQAQEVRLHGKAA